MRQNQRTPHIAVSRPDQRYCISALFRSEGYERLVRLATGDSVGIWRVWVFGADDRRGNRLIRLRSPKDTQRIPAISAMTHIQEKVPKKSSIRGFIVVRTSNQVSAIYTRIFQK